MTEIKILSATQIHVDGAEQMTGSFIAANPGEASRVVKLLSKWLEDQLTANGDEFAAALAKAHERTQQAEAAAEEANQKILAAQAACEEQVRTVCGDAQKAAEAYAADRKKFEEFIRQAKADIEATEQRLKHAEERERAHWNTIQVLMRGDAPAAVAAVQEIERINTSAEIARNEAEAARLRAKLAALPAVTP